MHKSLRSRELYRLLQTGTPEAVVCLPQKDGAFSVCCRPLLLLAAKLQKRRAERKKACSTALNDQPPKELRAEQVIDQYADMVFRLALSQTKRQADADDVFQEVFLRFLRNRDRFDFSRSDIDEYLKHWLIRVTVNCCHDFFSDRYRKNTDPLSESEQELFWEDPYESEAYAAVLALPPKYRLVIHLYYYEGFTVAEIAGMLKAATGTVKSQLSRGREMLRSTLKGGEDQ